MPFENYVLLVAFLAIVYSMIARVLQYKFTDRAAMKAFQAESKELSRKHKEAKQIGKARSACSAYVWARSENRAG